MTIAQMLADRLEKTGETQATMARHLGITPQTFNALLKGDIKVPAADVRRKLAKAFRLRHIDILVMVGELSADEVEPRRDAYPYDSEKAAVAALLADLDESEAFILRKTADAFIEVHEAKKVGAVEGGLLVPA